MWWRDDLDARALSGALGVTVRLRRARTPMAPLALTDGERRQWQALPTLARRRDWLLGRTALKAVLAPGSDTSVLTFPHPRLSLTHAGGLAVAVATGPSPVDAHPGVSEAQPIGGAVARAARRRSRQERETQPRSRRPSRRACWNPAYPRDLLAGTGVDHEPWRATDPRLGRFFLAPGERATSLGLLRAWTVKEALYKALPTNDGCSLLDVELDQPDASAGTASGPGGERLRYVVVDTADGPLAVAVCMRMEAVGMEAVGMEDRRVAV